MPKTLRNQTIRQKLLAKVGVKTLYITPVSR